MLTPQEVSEKTFTKASFGSSGYNMTAVDEFLDKVTEDYTTLYKENATLKAKLKVLAEKIEEYRATEDAMRSTLLIAQKQANSLVEEAQKQAAVMVEEAQSKKENILAAAYADSAEQIARIEAETAAEQAKLDAAKLSVTAYIEQAKQFCLQQLNYLEAVPEEAVIANAPVVTAPVVAAVPVVTAPAAPVVEEPVEEKVEEVKAVEEPAEPENAEEVAAEPELDELTKDTIASIEKGIESDLADQVLSQQLEETPAVVHEPLKKDPNAPGEFTMSLKELKFGRNYEKDI